ncbi:hypothetical protein BIV57_16320 [Mangrovactinospora gilvigrisea]|uniref:Formyl transferase N-terminal domain-containing protein n=1 Tax=Mangrovactinospora gilvigrisea TaxID=1428644 RepID=A0A1J7C4C7_9ACTN|nr:hypothetical protein [Mangrovactinospora gilvigrisea]OIV36428.1 hypothetical protein BIV57_16320 [Mangrovactinospora gilvigrisea]
MRISLCTATDLHGCLALNRLLPGLLGHDLQVLLDGTRPPGGDGDVPELARLSSFEREHFADLDEVFGEEPAGRLLTFRQLAARHRLPLHTVEGEESLRLLDGFRPDLIVALRFPAHGLPAAPLGVLDVHPGELPRFDGPLAPFWALAERRPVIGCTVRRIAPDGAAGAVLAERRLRVRPGRSLAWHIAQTYPLGVTALLEHLPAPAPGGRREGPAAAADPEGGLGRRYDAAPNAEEVRAFLRTGREIVAAADFDDLYGPFLGAGRTAPDPAPERERERRRVERPVRRPTPAQR